MSENLFELYSQKILALATQIPKTGTISAPNGEARKRSPICGSEIEVQVQMENDKINQYAQKVNACALGQASSAIFAESVIGRTELELETLRDELRAFLSTEGSAPNDPFSEYKWMEPAQAHRNRHASIMLPVETTLLAIEDVKKNRP